MWEKDACAYIHTSPTLIDQGRLRLHTFLTNPQGHTFLTHSYTHTYTHSSPTLKDASNALEFWYAAILEASRLCCCRSTTKSSITMRKPALCVCVVVISGLFTEREITNQGKLKGSWLTNCLILQHVFVGVCVCVCVGVGGELVLQFKVHPLGWLWGRE